MTIWKALKQSNGYVEFPGVAFEILKIPEDEEDMYCVQMHLLLRKGNEIDAEFLDGESISFSVGGCFSSSRDCIPLILSLGMSFEHCISQVNVLDLEHKVLESYDLTIENAISYPLPPNSTISIH